MNNNQTPLKLTVPPVVRIVNVDFFPAYTQEFGAGYLAFVDGQLGSSCPHDYQESFDLWSWWYDGFRAASEDMGFSSPEFDLELDDRLIQESVA